jgi:hypothetical protein
MAITINNPAKNYCGYCGEQKDGYKTVDSGGKLVCHKCDEINKIIKRVKQEFDSDKIKAIIKRTKENLWSNSKGPSIKL